MPLDIAVQVEDYTNCFAAVYQTKIKRWNIFRA